MPKKRMSGVMVVSCAHGVAVMPVQIERDEPKPRKSKKSTVGYSADFAFKWAKTFGVQNSDGAN